MKELNDTIKAARQRHPKSKNPREYVSCWVEKDVMDDEVVDAFVIILRTRGCSWALEGGCTMCGYINDASQKSVNEEDILHQFEKAMNLFKGEKIVKIFTSGSFLDENELPKTARDKILKGLSKKTEKVIIETRPEYITEENLKGLENIEIALGLESASDFVLENSINKGFKLKDYIKAASMLNEMDIGVKTYLLIKPPFLSEREAILDAVKSAEVASKYSRVISFNPVNVQRFTLVEKLWKNGEYRAPWLWSVVEVLRESIKLQGVRIMSSPTAGGTRRGAHNCGECDEDHLNGIREFSLTQDISFLDDLRCDCKAQWQDILSTEIFSKTHGDLLRLI